MCSACHRIRTDDGYWQEVSAYLYEHTDAELTHGICPDCLRRLYPDYADKLNEQDEI